MEFAYLIPTHRHHPRGRETETQRERQRHTHRDTERDRETKTTRQWQAKRETERRRQTEREPQRNLGIWGGVGGRQKETDKNTKVHYNSEMHNYSNCKKERFSIRWLQHDAYIATLILYRPMLWQCRAWKHPASGQLMDTVWVSQAGFHNSDGVRRKSIFSNMTVTGTSACKLFYFANYVFCVLCSSLYLPRAICMSRWRHSSGLTPSLSQPVKFLGWKVHAYKPPNSIFDGPITNIISILSILIVELFSCAHGKEAETHGKEAEKLKP